MNKIERTLRREFPDHTIVKSRNGHYKIYDDAGCLVTTSPGSPGEHHWLMNARQQAARHVCPARVPVPAI